MWEVNAKELGIYVSSPEQVEAMAGCSAVRLAQERGLSPVVFETDSMILITFAVRQESHIHLHGTNL